MDLMAAGGFVTIVGAVLYLAATAPMARIYGGRDADAVIEAIRTGWRRYVTSQLLFGSGSVFTGVGAALMAPGLADVGQPVLALAGAVAMLGGGALWAWLCYDRTVNYERFFRSYGTFGWAGVGWLILTGAGLAVYGMLFLDAGAPPWVAYAVWGLVALQVVGAIVVPKIVPPQIYYLAALLLGVTAVVQA